MVKAKPQQFGMNTGYSNWSVMRTIREAENIARWAPWKTHEWMNDAQQRLDIVRAPYHEEYDAAVSRINYLWKTNRSHRWYNERDFWMDGKISRPPKMLEPLFDI
jgi:hypothetical protein